MGSLKPKPGPSCILKRPSLLETPCTLLTTELWAQPAAVANSSPACRLLAVTTALQELCRAACALPQVRVVLFSAYFLLEGGKGRKARLSLRQLVKWDAPALLGAAEEEAICVGKHLPPLQQAAVPETGVSAETMKDKKKMPCSRAIFTRVVQFLIQQAYSSSSTSLITLAAILGVA